SPASAARRAGRDRRTCRRCCRGRGGPAAPRGAGGGGGGGRRGLPPWRWRPPPPRAPRTPRPAWRPPARRSPAPPCAPRRGASGEGGRVAAEPGRRELVRALPGESLHDDVPDAGGRRREITEPELPLAVLTADIRSGCPSTR